MATIHESIYDLQFSTSDAIKQLEKSINTIEKHQKAVDGAKRNSKEWHDANEKLKKSQQDLEKLLGTQTKTTNQLENKQSILLQTLKGLERNSKQYKAVLAELIKTNKELAEVNDDVTKGMQTLSDKLQSGIDRVKNFTVAGVGIAAVGGSLEYLNSIVTETDGKLSQVQQRFEELSKDQVEDLTSSIDGLANAYGQEFDEVTAVINTASNEFKENPFDVFDALSVGMNNAATDLERGELLEQLREYSTFFNKAGLDITQSVALINEGADLSIFSDRLSDFLKESNILLSEGEKNIREGVAGAFGQSFSDDLFNRIQNEGLPTFAALQEIAEKIGTTDLNPRQYQMLVTSLGSAAAEDGGQAIFEAIRNVSNATEQSSEALTENQKRLQKQIEYEKELADTKIQLTNQVRDLSNEYLETSQSLQLYLLRGLQVLIELLRAAPKFISENRYALLALAGAYAVLLLRKKGITAATARENAQQTIKIAKDKLSAFWTQAKSKANWKFVKSQGAVNLAMKAAPYAIAAAAIAYLVTQAIKMTKANNDAARQTRLLNNAINDITKDYVKQRAELDYLFGAVEKTTFGTNEHRKAIEAIDERYGTHLGNIKNEKELTEALTKAKNEQNQAILNEIAARLKAQAIEEAIIKQQELIVKKNNAERGSGGSGGGVFARIKRGTNEKRLAEANREIAAIEKELQNMEKTFDEAIENVAKTFEGKDLSDIFIGKKTTGTGETASTTIAKETKKVREETKAAAGSIAALEQEISKLENVLKNEIDVTIDKAKAKEVFDEIIKLKDKLETAKQALADLDKREPVAVPVELDRKTIKLQTPQFKSDTEQILNTDKVQLQIEIDAKKAAEDAAAAQKAAKLAAVKETISEVANATEQVSNLLFDAVGKFQQRKANQLSEAVDESKNALDKMLSNSEDYNAKQVQLEQKRLAEREKAQEKHTRKMKALQVAQVVANTAIGIAKTFAESGAGSPIVLPIVLAALSGALAIGSTLAGDAFKDGTDFLQLPSGAKRGTDTIQGFVGHRPIRLDEGEAIIQRSMNEKRHNAVKAIRRNGQLGDDLEMIAKRFPNGVGNALHKIAANSYQLRLNPVTFNYSDNRVVERLNAVEQALLKLPEKIPPTAIGLDNSIVTKNVTKQQQRMLRTQRRAK